MKDERKTKAQLIDELAELRGKIAELKTSKDEQNQTKSSSLGAEESLKFLFREGPAFNIVVGTDGAIKDVSKASLKETGYSRGEIIGRQVLEFIVPEHREKALAEIEKGFNGEDTAEVEIGIRAKDGSIRTILFSAGQVLLYEGDQLTGILFTGIDVTERKLAEEALRRSEERYRLVVENASEVIIVAQDEKLTFANPKAEELLGYSMEELTSVPFVKFIHSEDQKMVVERYRRRLEGKNVPEVYPFRIVTKNGEVKWVEINAVRIEWEGKPATLNFLSDITERRLAEEALIESEREKQIILDSLSAFVLFHTTDMEIVWANRAAAESINMTADQLIGRHCYELWHKRNEPCEGCPVVRALEMGEKQVGETTTPEGRKWIVRGYPVRDHQGNLVGVVETVQDITERKRADEALRKSEKRYRQLVESVNDIIYRIDKNGRFTYVNPAAERIVKHSREELIGKNYLELIRPDYRERVRSFYRRQCERKTPITYLEFPVIDKRGEDVWIGQNVQLAIEGDEIVGFQAVARNITERKRLEEEQMKVEKLESLGILAGGIAHDFNNLLMGIMGNISLAKVHIDPEAEAFRRLTDAEKASAQAKNLTQQLLTFSKGAAPIKKTVSTLDLIEDSADFALRGSNVKCEFSLPDDLWTVEADEGQVSQVIQNIVLNADQSMPEGGTIRIGAENIEVSPKHGLPLEQGWYVRISIADQGVGIPPEHLRKIFDPYFTTKQRGSGLGLATSYSIIRNHNGYIDVDSELGVGTTFFIYLPASKKDLPKQKVKEEKPLAGKGRILVMDDEEIIRGVVGSMLESLGYQVEFAENGAEAVEKYRRNVQSGTPFDLVILDLTVPGRMGGKEAVKWVLDIDPDAKVVVSSGYSDDPVMADFRRYGFKGVIPKPYDVNELSKVLHNLIAQEND